MWEYLKEIALIGTDKKALDPRELPAEITAQLSDLEKQDDEGRFLQVSALASYFVQSGKMPAKVEDGFELPIVEESMEIAPKEVLKAFDLIYEANYQIKEYLFGIWVDFLIAKSWIVSPGQIQKVVALADVLGKSAKKKINQIIGDKGKWLLSFGNGSNLQENEPVDLWQEGTTAQRKAFLNDTLRTNPLQGLELLKSTWETESIAAKKSFLGLLSNHYDEGFTDFLEGLYNGEFAWKLKEKKTEKECRAIVARLLLRSLESQLHQDTVAQLVHYFGVRKRSGMLSFMAAAQSVFELPEGTDDFWSLERMERTYGLDQQYDIALFAEDKLYWLSTFIAHVPASWWAAHFDKGYDGFVNYFLADPAFQTRVDGKRVHIYLDALVGNAVHAKGAELSQRLLQEADKDTKIKLLPSLPLPQYEAYLIKADQVMNYHLLECSPAGTWSEGFSKDIVGHAYEQLKKDAYYALQQMGEAMVKHIHPNTERVLEKYHEKAKALSYFNSWEKHVYTPLKITMSIKQLIESYKQQQ